MELEKGARMYGAETGPQASQLIPEKCQPIAINHAFNQTTRNLYQRQKQQCHPATREQEVEPMASLPEMAKMRCTEICTWMIQILSLQIDAAVFTLHRTTVLRKIPPFAPEFVTL